ncbi:MAG: Mut7-C RNAse domain-containing protein [Ignavibacteriales bacterium]|nr:Mut7-C RNAse domain-containing protein [Ignavibacteriales bacterium]
MTFVADCMLGRLAKWLRILGFDVLYFSKAEDPDLVAIARREGRVLLTRDTGLIERTARRPDRLFVRSDRLGGPGRPGPRRIRALGRGRGRTRAASPATSRSSRSAGSGPATS